MGSCSPIGSLIFFRFVQISTAEGLCNIGLEAVGTMTTITRVARRKIKQKYCKDTIMLRKTNSLTGDAKKRYRVIEK